MLKIGIHQYHNITRGVGEPGGKRHFLAEVPAETQDLQSRFADAQRLKHGKRAIVAAIVHAEDLDVHGDALKYRSQSTEQRLHIAFFVVHRNDDGKRRHGQSTHLTIKAHVPASCHLNTRIASRCSFAYTLFSLTYEPEMTRLCWRTSRFSFFANRPEPDALATDHPLRR